MGLGLGAREGSFMLGIVSGASLLYFFTLWRLRVARKRGSNTSPDLSLFYGDAQVSGRSKRVA
jgi:hypothetical protein